jgi:carboxyl-terminal processing protease
MQYYFQERKKQIFKKFLFFLSVIILTAAGFFAGLYFSAKSQTLNELAKKEVALAGKVINKYSDSPEGVLSQDINFKLFWEVWDTLKKEYVDKDKLNEKEMFYGAVKGLVNSAGDPYTVFMDPKLTQEFGEDLAGVFEGIGAEIGIRKNILTVISPLDGAPAEKAGLKAGDKIYFINGKTTSDLTIDEAVSKIRGPKGTSVTLTIFRNGMERPQDFIITRSQIVIKSVKTEEKDGIFIIKIANFSNDTKSLLDEAIRKILAGSVKGVIIDLRNNPGGYLDTAVEIASEWIEEGTVVSERFSADKKDDFPARGKARLKNYKTVVLVNEGSASASEIVAGALKDYGLATVVGKQTFGKGSVQSLENFGDGSSLKMTVAKWYTPQGVNINEQGIKPDIEVDVKAEELEKNIDRQMEKAEEIIKKGK